jgi:hypothetical protein
MDDGRENTKATIKATIVYGGIQHHHHHHLGALELF